MPDYFNHEFKEDEQIFSSLSMPMSNQINLKTLFPPNQPLGAFYRGVLHFGVLLHDLVEVQSCDKAEYEVEIERLDIRWDLFVSKMKSIGVQAPPVVKANKIEIKSMQRELLPEEKILKKQKRDHVPKQEAVLNSDFDLELRKITDLLSKAGKSDSATG